MPRGKRTVFAVFCAADNSRLGSVRLHKQDKMGKAWKEHAQKFSSKFCPTCRKRVDTKLKEEKHSS
ncbi:MAG: hypothetical protein G01um101425_656 [Candidatus Peregrinibacteria bacterium Gr01-1014_25]|nr:MAG: hypothetical protein G01um101425_656 [Candidatus Peregrinibacteria bacterium Gr01-1014_25]